MRRSGEPPEGRVQEGVRILRTGNTTVRITAKGRTQREMMRARFGCENRSPYYANKEQQLMWKKFPSGKNLLCGKILKQRFFFSK